MLLGASSGPSLNAFQIERGVKEWEDFRALSSETRSPLNMPRAEQSRARDIPALIINVLRSFVNIKTAKLRDDIFFLILETQQLLIPKYHMLITYIHIRSLQDVLDFGQIAIGRCLDQLLVDVSGLLRLK